MKTEGKGERNLRSASPHRNSYKSDFHAIKCSFDGMKPEISPKPASLKSNANGAPADLTRGRASYGNRVHKIKNMFMQMSSTPSDNQNESKLIKPECSSPPANTSVVSVQRNNAINVSPDLPVQEKVVKAGEDEDLDKATLAEKFSETRKLFERNLNKQATFDRSSPTKEEKPIRLERRHGSVDVESSSSDLSPNINSSKLTKSSSVEISQISHRSTCSSSSSSSLNAGPISKRLESFLADSDGEELRDLSKTDEILFDTTASSVTSNHSTSLNVTGENNNEGTTNVAVEQPLVKTQSQDCEENTESPVTKEDAESIQNNNAFPDRKSWDVARPMAEKTQTEMVRAELVVLQNESSESEEDADLNDDDVFDDIKPLESQPCVNGNQQKVEDHFQAEKEIDDKKDDFGSDILEKTTEEATDDVDSDDEEEGSESEEQSDRNKNLQRYSSGAFGIENAAFDDDQNTETEQPLADDEKLRAEDEDYDLGSTYDEVPGLSEEEELPVRKVKFSKAPIKVKLMMIFFFFAPAFLCFKLLLKYFVCHVNLEFIVLFIFGPLQGIARTSTLGLQFLK